MIPVILALGAVIVGGGLLAAFWEDILGFLKKAIRKVQQVVEGVLYGSKVLIRKLSDGFKEISRHYSKLGDVWQETTVTRTVSASQVPEDIRKRAERCDELDITDELEMELQSA